VSFVAQAPLIHPVILCGGEGRRLWPESRPQRPKPFLKLLGDRTLFEATVERFSGDRSFAEPIVVAGPDHAPLVEECMGRIPHRLIVEPAGRGTAPAIALAAHLLAPANVMLIAPSDHVIADLGACRDAAHAAARIARSGRLVLLGVTPDRPETGYGYARRGEPIGEGFAVAEFLEKPNTAKADAYIESGDYHWNSGIFAFRADTVLQELALYRPGLVEAISRAVERGRAEGARFYPNGSAMAEIPTESIDRALMENTDRAAVVPVDMGWSDIGMWPALREALAANEVGGDEHGNVTTGRVELRDCRDVLARTDGPRISAIGVEDLCIIVSDGEILITSRDTAQRVGDLPGIEGD